MGVNRVVPVVPRTPQEGGGVVTHGPRISRLVTTGAVIAVLSGAQLAGVLGALAAIPVAGTLQVLLVAWLEDRRKRHTRPATV